MIKKLEEKVQEEIEERIEDMKEQIVNGNNYECILLQLPIMEDKIFMRAKKNPGGYKTSNGVTIIAMDEKIYVGNVPTGLKAALLLYNIQQRTKILLNPA